MSKEFGKYVTHDFNGNLIIDAHRFEYPPYKPFKNMPYIRGKVSNIIMSNLP